MILTKIVFTTFRKDYENCELFNQQNLADLMFVKSPETSQL